MARKKNGNNDVNQLGFDFLFNQTIDTVERLQSEQDTDDGQKGVDHDSRTTAAAGNRSENSQAGNAASSEAITVIPSTRMEDSRPVGIQHPGETTGAGSEGRGDLAEQIAGTAGGGTPSLDHGRGTTTERPDGTRDSGNERDQYRTLVASDYLITDQDQLGDGGAKTKFRDNIAALRLLKTLQSEGRPALQTEQAILVRYVGWGGLPQAFDHLNQDWQKEYRELAALLSKEEYERARRSTQDAHYTSQTVIEGIYKGLQHIGFAGGKMLEPAGGIGNFIGLMPATLAQESHITTIELDPLTSAIGKLLYPSATHINKGFQDVVIPAGYFDAVVGNPPFGGQSLYDPHHRELSDFSIHNFFVAKSLDKLREGGIMAIVISRYFLDANNSQVREYVADRAHFLGAIRLPNNAFRRNALTEVTTDIVFLQKTKAGESSDRTWVNLGEVRDYETGEAIALNQYYVDRPAQMIGRMAITGNMYGEGSVDLIPEPGIDLATAIAERIRHLPENIYAPVAAGNDVHLAADKPAINLPDTVKVGSFFVTPNGRIARRLPNLLDQADYIYVEVQTERAAERIKGMIHIKGALRQLMLAEQSEQANDETLINRRRELNQAYDQFVRKCGHISSQANRLAMHEDPEYPLLHALERDYDRGVSAEMAKKHGVSTRPASAKKAAIFEKRVIAPRKEITHVESAKDALVVSMNESGRIDLARMVMLTGKPEDELVGDLKGLIFRNPASNQWETADQYLTGNVKSKLREAEQAARQNPRYRENVEALHQAQPAPIEPVDIAVQLGSTWVPVQVVNQFVTHLLGDVRQLISYQEAIGKWVADIGKGDRTTAHVTWGTEDYPANALIESILTNRPIQVKERAGTDPNGKPIYRVNDSLTTAAHQKADEIRQAFIDWVWEDKERRELLASNYNERFNTNIPAKYDGVHLTLQGASLGISLRPHQKDAVWRGIQDGTALFDHVVGAGKTIVCIGTIMESKRMGLMTKPMLLVPNHLLLQWKDAFYSLYPNASILVAEKSDFKKENRERLFSSIATGDWDAVIVAHSSFKKIGMPGETLDQILNEQIDDLTSAIQQAKAANGDRITIKEMEKAKDRMRARLERKADTGAKDQAVNFADLGIDALLVDEAHEFKNLFVTTTLSGVSGLGNLSGSEKAFDLFVKCRYLQQRNNGRGVFFATGTPISNTIAELYTMQRYLQYDELKARGIVHFDAWASTFGQVVTGWELDATGVNYRLNSRFSKFQNVPELIGLYRTFADVITKADLDRQAAEQGLRFPIPKIKGGRPQNIVVERSALQAQFMDSIIWRMEHLPKDPRKDNPLKITNEARKAGLDFRLISAQAPDDEGSKINEAIENVYRIWGTWKDRRGTQLVFCDLSTPKQIKKAQLTTPINNDDADDDGLPVISMDELLADQSAFSVYDDIKAKLIQRGIPENEIRFIHEPNTDLQKSKLFDEMNRGLIRVLLGSTPKMGAGTNVQRKLVAEHHLDAPWRPSDLEQREGRILRQGNEFYDEDPDGFEVEILRYATKQTYDSRMWQTIEYKASSIEQFRKGDSLQRVIEDVAGEAANAAEMKAAATGNPLIFLQVQLSADLKKLEAIHANYKRNQHSLESRAVWLANADNRADQATARWDNEITRRDQSTSDDFRFQIRDRIYKQKEDEALLQHVTVAMKQAIAQRASNLFDKAIEVPVGCYRGFNIDVHARFDEVQFSLRSEDVYKPNNLCYRAQEKFSFNGFVNRVDNFLSKFENWRREAEESRMKEKREYEKARQELVKPFPQQARLDALRQDARDVMTELKLMQADGNYVSSWKPCSAEDFLLTNSGDNSGDKQPNELNQQRKTYALNS